MELTLPVVMIKAPNLPEGWEKAVEACWEQGARIPTQYDQVGDPKSRDISLVLAVADVMAEPRIHRALPGGLFDLEKYAAEVVEGPYDHWIDPEAGKWEYTYHERVTSYRVPGLVEPINQLDYVVEALTEAPHSRRAQAVVWKPWEDAGIEYPACLQRMWFRVFGDELVMSIDIRSNDAFKAGFMNMYGFAELQMEIARRLSASLGREIRAGQYIHHADSFHIYGTDFEQFEGFMKLQQHRSFRGRTYSATEAKEHLIEARQKLISDLQREKEKAADQETASRIQAAIDQMKERYRHHPLLPMDVDEP